MWFHVSGFLLSGGSNGMFASMGVFLMWRPHDIQNLQLIFHGNIAEKVKSGELPVCVPAKESA
jgi:hypothetical protein